MTEETHNNAIEATKSAEEQLADVVKTAVETKADATAVAELKSAVEAMEIPSLEGYMKSADVEEKFAELHNQIAEGAKANEELEALVKSAPSTITNIKEDSPMFNFTKLADQEAHGLVVDYKSYDDNTNVEGAPVAGQTPFFALEQMNQFRQLSSIIPVSSGSIKLPESSAIVFATEDSVDTSRTQQGGLSSTTLIIDNYVSSVQVSKPSLEDVMGFDAVIGRQMLQGLGRKEAEDMVTALNGATITEVDTGVAAGLPVKADIIGYCGELMAALSAAYLPGAVFVMSRGAMAAIRAASDGEYAYDPAMGITSLLGYPVYVNDYVDAGNAADDNAIYFGNFNMGTVIAQRKSLTIGRYEQTSPGFMTYFGEARSRMDVWDTNALVRSNNSA